MHPETVVSRHFASELISCTLIRIRIEHALGGVKRDRIVKDQSRLIKDGIRESIMETCGGLPNFPLQDRPWHYAF